VNWGGDAVDPRPAGKGAARVAQDVIRIRCPNLLCGRVLVIPGHARGKRVKCRACATVMSVPDKKKDVPAASKQGGENSQAA
jgi:ribosomal protein S27E